VIAISAKVLGEIRAHGRDTYPEECCGGLLGRRGDPARVIRIERIDNVRDVERARRYEVSPQDYLRLERLAAQEEVELLGFYHSHPDHPAVPSAYDRDHAFPFFHYLVCAVASGQPGEVTGWVLSEDRGEFDPEPILEEET
jgi:proteasome lid subunit RPN8/RPN11